MTLQCKLQISPRFSYFFFFFDFITVSACFGEKKIFLGSWRYDMICIYRPYHHDDFLIEKKNNGKSRVDFIWRLNDSNFLSLNFYSMEYRRLLATEMISFYALWRKWIRKLFFFLLFFNVEEFPDLKLQKLKSGRERKLMDIYVYAYRKC